MLTTQWSPELSNIVAALKQLDSFELVSRLKDSHFIDSWKVTAGEKQAIMKAFSSNEELTTMKVSPASWWSN
jgi:hypothetical protein